MIIAITTFTITISSIAAATSYNIIIVSSGSVLAPRIIKVFFILRMICTRTTTAGANNSIETFHVVEVTLAEVLMSLGLALHTPYHVIFS